MSKLRAGAARMCITPSIGCHIAGYMEDRIATDILDDLYAKALVLENDRTSLAIVICDLIALERSDIDLAKQRAQERTGFPSENILIAATHTHYGPNTTNLLGVARDERYMDEVAERIAGAVKLAQNRLVPAEVGVASGWCPGETFNRRWWMKDGTVRDNFAIGYENPDRVRPAGPTDPEIVVLVVRDKQRRPICLLANYSLHYVGGPYDLAISADYFGHFDRAIQSLAGYRFVGIMANGCCGDVNNIDISRPRPEMPYPTYQAERVANVLAAAVYGAWQGLRDFDYCDEPALAAATETVMFRRREPSEQQVQLARAMVEGRIKPDPTAPRFAPLEFAKYDLLYARELLAVLEEPVERPTPVMALRVGELGIVGLGGEMFVQYGLQIKEQSPFKKTMVIELANDYLGYCPTDQALQEGSYETVLARSAKAAPGTEGAMVLGALTALRRVAAC